jgi:hypothetical protein
MDFTPWGGEYRSWQELPRLFAVIWCWFPEREEKKPDYEVHPTLVAGILRSEVCGTHLRCWAVDVIMGTSNNLKIEQRGHIDLIIAEKTGVLEDMGLKTATRFDLGKRTVIPWCTDFFGGRRPAGYLNVRYQSLLQTRLRNARTPPFQPLPGKPPGAFH